MSDQLDLDEIDEVKLRAELIRREEARKELLCDYCGRYGDSEPCKFPERHLIASIALSHRRRLEEGYLPPGTYIGGASEQRPPKPLNTKGKRGRK